MGKRLIVSLDLGNAAFQDLAWPVEMILADLGRRVDSDNRALGETYPLRDWNGNTCGEARIVSSPPNSPGTRATPGPCPHLCGGCGRVLTEDERTCGLRTCPTCLEVNQTPPGGNLDLIA